MDAEEKIYGLIALAEEQQQELQAIVKSLQEERKFIAQELKKLGTLQYELLYNVSSGSKKAVESVLSASLDRVSTDAESAIVGAARPVIDDLRGMARAASEAEGKISAAVSAFGWRWGVLVACATGGGILALLIAAWLAGTWQLKEVTELKKQHAAITREIERQKRTLENLGTAGGRVKLEFCGKEKRLCAAIDESAPSFVGMGSRFYILEGY